MPVLPWRGETVCGGAQGEARAPRQCNTNKPGPPPVEQRTAGVSKTQALEMPDTHLAGLYRMGADNAIGDTAMDWSIVTGLGVGLGLPAMTGLFLIVRMENRVTSLERDRDFDQRWREMVTATLQSIARDVNQLIGKAEH